MDRGPFLLLRAFHPDDATVSGGQSGSPVPDPVTHLTRRPTWQFVLLAGPISIVFLILVSAPSIFFDTDTWDGGFVRWFWQTGWVVALPIAAGAILALGIHLRDWRWPRLCFLVPLIATAAVIVLGLLTLTFRDFPEGTETWGYELYLFVVLILGLIVAVVGLAVASIGTGIGIAVEQRAQPAGGHGDEPGR